ncbi:MAG: sigma-54-dependent transcriptional regulator [Bacteroidota bacterium]
MSHVLIVEDNRDSTETVAALVAVGNCTIAVAGSLREARQQLALHPPDVILLDLALPDGNGMELFSDAPLLEKSKVVLITEDVSLEKSIQAFSRGAVDYLTKPVAVSQLEDLLSRLVHPAPRLNGGEPDGDRFGHLLGRSPAMRRIYEQISRVAATSVTVFITGESGTGKEMVARTVHDLSRRRDQPFLAVNCGAISPTLIESEIFGHEKGSFTGAERQHAGFFERAHGGTLFLDEITEMPLELQVKLLRVLETGMLMRVGSTQSREADVRVIAATNRAPEQAVASGHLREDLLYRLNVFPIALPPLRNRPEDIPLLANHFLGDICLQEGQCKRFSAAALSRLASYRWTGNVRELRNVVQRAYLMATGNVITNEWLPSDVLSSPAGNDEAAVNGCDNGARITIPLGTTLAKAEYQLILATLQHFNNHKERTAAVLGVSLKTLYNRLKEYANGHDDAAPGQMVRTERRQAAPPPPD